MSRVEDIAPDAVKIGMRVKFRVHKPGRRRSPDPRVHSGGRVMDGLKRGAAAIVGRRRIRSRAGRRRHEPDGPVRAGHLARARRLRAHPEGRRRPVLRHDAAAHVDRVADRISRHRAEVHRLLDDRRLVVRVSCRAGGGRDRGRPVQRGGDRLRLDPAQRRPQAGLAARGTIRTRRRSSRSCRRAPMRSRPRATCISTARRASSSPKSRSRRASGRSSIRSRGRRSR